MWRNPLHKTNISQFVCQCYTPYTFVILVVLQSCLSEFWAKSLMFWIHSEILSFLLCLALNNRVAWKPNVRFSVYVFFKNVLKLSQFFRFLCVTAFRGSALILVNTDLYNTREYSGSITSHGVSTFEVNANTSLLSPLKWTQLQSFTDWYVFSHDFTLMPLLSFKGSALYGARLTARKIRVTAACGAAPRSSVLSSWLLPLVLLPLAASCRPVSAAGCCPSFCCTWRDGCCPVPAAGCCLSFCYTWWLLLLPRSCGWLLPLILLHLMAGCCISFCCTWRLLLPCPCG